MTTEPPERFVEIILDTLQRRRSEISEKIAFLTRSARTHLLFGRNMEMQSLQFLKILNTEAVGPRG